MIKAKGRWGVPSGSFSRGEPRRTGVRGSTSSFQKKPVKKSRSTNKTRLQTSSEELRAQGNNGLHA